jgi:hypothetical protein
LLVSLKEVLYAAGKVIIVSGLLNTMGTSIPFPIKSPDAPKSCTEEFDLFTAES